MQWESSCYIREVFVGFLPNLFTQYSFAGFDLCALEKMLSCQPLHVIITFHVTLVFQLSNPVTLLLTFFKYFPCLHEICTLQSIMGYHILFLGLSVESIVVLISNLILSYHSFPGLFHICFIWFCCLAYLWSELRLAFSERIHCAFLIACYLECWRVWLMRSSQKPCPHCRKKRAIFHSHVRTGKDEKGLILSQTYQM